MFVTQQNGRPIKNTSLETNTVCCQQTWNVWTHSPTFVVVKYFLLNIPNYYILRILVIGYEIVQSFFFAGQNVFVRILLKKKWRCIKKMADAILYSLYFVMLLFGINLLSTQGKLKHIFYHPFPRCIILFACLAKVSHFREI